MPKQKKTQAEKGTVLYLCIKDGTEFRGTTWGRGDLMALPTNEKAPEGFEPQWEINAQAFVVDLDSDGQTPAIFIGGKKRSEIKWPESEWEEFLSLWLVARVPVENRERGYYAYQDHLFQIGPALSSVVSFIVGFSPEAVEIGHDSWSVIPDTIRFVEIYKGYRSHDGRPEAFWNWFKNSWEYSWLVHLERVEPDPQGRKPGRPDEYANNAEAREKVCKVFERHKKGHSQRMIARDLDIPRGRVKYILTKKKSLIAP